MEFNEIYIEATKLLSQLEGTAPQSIQYQPLEMEFVSLVHDLESINHLSVDQRTQISNLKSQLTSMRNKEGANSLKGQYGENPFDSPEDIQSATNDYHQQLLQEQDLLISTQLTQSINNLHQQAMNINEELEDQGSLLDQVEDSMDRLNLKIIGTGMKRMNKFLETNEWGGNCCILLLIIVLAMLLVLLIIA